MTDKEIQAFGRNFTRGVFQYLGMALMIFLIVYGVVGSFTGAFDYDDTDGQSTRSGMKLRHDYGTGCQYLESRDGFLTPRLGRDGMPVCHD